MTRKPHEGKSPLREEQDLSHAPNAEVQAPADQDEDSILSGVKMYASKTKKELRERARELGIRGRSSMDVAQLAEAVVRAELGDPSGTSSISPTSRASSTLGPQMRSMAQQEVQSVAQQEVQAAVQHVRSAMRSSVRSIAEQEVRSAVQQFRSAVESAAQQEVRSVAQQEMRSVAQRQVQSAVRQVRSAVRSAVRQEAGQPCNKRPGQPCNKNSSRPCIERSGQPRTTSRQSSRSKKTLQKSWRDHGKLLAIRDSGESRMEDASDSADEFNDWIRKKGGTDVGATFLDLVVTGERQGGVVVTGMKASFAIPRSQPLRGTLFYAKPESGKENIALGFNLDEENPVARELRSEPNPGRSGSLGRDYFDYRHVTLGASESHVFKIVATITKYYCEWYIDIQVEADGRSQTVRIGFIDDQERSQQKKPFRTTAQVAPTIAGAKPFSAYKYLYVLDSTPPIGFINRDPAAYAG